MAPLRERDWEVTFITPDGPDVARAADLGYRWLPLRFTRRIDVLGDASASVALASMLARERFDIAHTHNVKVGMVGRVLARMVRTPIVVHTMHGSTWSLETPLPTRVANALLERVASLAADLLLAQSQTDRDAFVAMKVVPPERIRVIGNGIDLARFDPQKLPGDARRRVRDGLGVREDETLVLFPGRMVREKGLDEVFAAARLLRGEPIRIALAGRDDAERGDAPARAPEDSDGNILILGERHDMPEVYAAADVVGLASWREGIPRVLMEAAAMARPTIASDVRGCREVVRHGVTGELVPVRSPEALAGAIRKLSRDPALRESLGRAGRREALEHFDVRTSVQRVVAAYDDLLERKGLS